MSSFYPNGLPQQLKDNGRFCVWRYETREGSAKPTKCPYNPRTGGGAMSNNPDTFTNYQEAVNTLERGGFDGLGVGVFDGLCAIDIDHCIDKNGVPTNEATEIMYIMQTYCETSPSGQGLRLFFTAPGFQYDKTRFYTMNASRGLEVYVCGATSKFLTVTGNSQPWGGVRPIEERGVQLQAILEKFMERPRKPAPEPQQASQARIDMEDNDLIAKAHHAKNGAQFAALWNGDLSGYGSHSEADMALCNLLAFWTGRNPTQMDRLFRLSGLMRNKWDRPQSGSTYGALTIQEAIRTCSAVYEPNQVPQRGRGTYASRATQESVKPPDNSDAGNADAFTRRYRDNLLFSDALGWLVWNGKRWERNDHQALTLATQLSGEMLADAQRENRAALVGLAEAKADEVGPQELERATMRAAEAKAYLSHAKQSRGAGRLKSMLEVSKPSFVVKADTLDANPSELNTPAGIVDLTTGAIRPHDRGARCTQITANAPGKQGAQTWDTFLDTITQHDGSLRGFLQLVAGMALHGKVYHEGLILAHGAGRNGKSTFFNALAAVLGDYAGSLDIDTFTTDKQNRGAALATLRGKRLVIAGELEEGKRLSVATVKKVCSTDRITIEEKYKQPETITPSHTLCLFTNHLPRVGSTDPGTWRRLIVVPFRATIPTQDARSNYGDTLVKQAGAAILSWAIQGAVNFARNGYRLQIPDVVEEVTEAYRGQEDWVGNFLTECCSLGQGAWVPSSELYQRYRAWAERSGDYVRRLPDFNAAMEGRGFTRKKTKTCNVWQGVA